MSGNNNIAKAADIEDLRRIAMRNIPRAFFEYADHGSYTQSTMRPNQSDLSSIHLRQRVAIDVDNRDLSTTILARKPALPFALAPIGLCGIQHGNGEILAARAAQKAGIPFRLSAISICSIDDVAAAVSGPFSFGGHGSCRETSRHSVRPLLAASLTAASIALIHEFWPTD